MIRDWLENDETVCDGCGMVFNPTIEDDCIAIEEQNEHYCTECADNIRRGKVLLSIDQREDLRNARKKNCGRCGKRLPIGRSHLLCRGCADESFVRFFGESKFREMVLDRERRANG